MKIAAAPSKQMRERETTDLQSRRFANRAEAGRELARCLRPVITAAHPLVLALQRGGVPVGFEVARALDADLDVFIVRKLGVPGHEELAMGAIASGGSAILNQALIDELGISAGAMARLVARERREIARREALYRDDRPPPRIAGRTVILVDDGLATGASMLAAARAVEARHPERIVVAVPVASRQACEEFRHRVDEVVCARTPEPFYAVGVWYKDFSQTSDEEVRDLLRRAGGEQVP
ncbi:MAG TPA: phosphoribosyltransferase [Bryobacteraceae bacterium]|nr:phosphoribosyltransferase [Bryobacteraceae bacterium]